MDLLRTPWDGTAVAVPAPVATSFVGLPAPSGAVAVRVEGDLLAYPWSGTAVIVAAPPALTGLPVLTPSVPGQRAPDDVAAPSAV